MTPSLLDMLKRRFMGPNPEDYADGYEDCRKEILAYLETLNDFRAYLNADAQACLEDATLAVMTKTWREMLRDMRHRMEV